MTAPPGELPTPVTVVAGPAGIGRTTALARIRAAAGQRGAPVVSLRLAPPDRELALHLTSRLLSLLPAPLPSTVDGTRGSAGRHAAALAEALAAGPGAVVLVDDAQWMDEPSLAVLERAVRRLPGTAARLVCAVRTPAGTGPATGRAVFERLRADGLASVVTLRPLAAAELDAVVTELVQARPHPGLRRYLGRVSRGVPAALRAVVEAHHRAGSLRVVDHLAHLTGPADAIDLPAGHGLFAPVRALPEPAWAVAKAVAVLHPLDGAVADLAAAALDLPPEVVEAALGDLVAAGVLRVRAHGGRRRWRFAVPLVGAGLRALLGPFERRCLARVAVHALWDGTARCADPGYLPDRLVEAGRLVDGARAAGELRARAAAAPAAAGPAAARWLAAAAELATGPDERATALLARAGTHCLCGDFAAALADTRSLTGEHAGDLTWPGWERALLLHVTALRGAGDLSTVERIAAGAGGLPGPDPARTAARALALSMLDRLVEAERLLDGAAGGPDAATLAAAVATLRGRPVAGDVAAPGEPWRVAPRVRALAVLGDTGAAGELLRGGGLAEDRLPEPDRALLAWRRGRWDETLDRFRAGVAAGTLAGHDPGYAALCQAAATVHLGRGRPRRARTLLAAARAGRPALAHLLDLAEARVALAFGDPVAASARVAAGLAAASASGAVPGTAELWLLWTEMALARGDREAARHGLRETGRLAEATATPYVRVHHLLARAAVERDPAAAAGAVAAARALDQPYLLAGALRRAAAGAPDPARALAEAYELYGALDAGLHRCWLRGEMRARDVAVPGRGETVVENERLLATLVAEGASNRELAAVLRTSEKSVEGRLSRLFARTGCRSRVELATAVITGGYGTE